MTLLITAVKTAISEVHKLLRTVGALENNHSCYLFGIVVLVMADGLFGLCGSKRAAELFISLDPPPHLPPLYPRP